MDGWKEILDFNLRESMNSLEQTLEYYVSIEPRGAVEYETAYHGIIVDPDGNSRNLLDERDKNLQASKEIVEFVNSLPGGKILDLGCGLGWLLSAIDRSWQKHGIEISQFAGNHASQYGSIFIGNFEDYEEGQFDVIVMNHVIEHLTSPESALRFVKEKLKPGGYLVLATPNFDSGAARRYGMNYRLLHDPTHITLFSEDSIRRFVRDNGFVIVKVDFPYFETDWFNINDLNRLFDLNQISPPFYGSYLTIFARFYG
jgi:SAM-dependent methyltransferase